MTMVAKGSTNDKSTASLASKKVNLNEPNAIKHLLDETTSEVSTYQTLLRTGNYYSRSPETPIEFWIIIYLYYLWPLLLNFSVSA